MALFANEARFFRFRVFFRACSLLNEVGDPPFFYISDITNSSTFKVVKVSEKNQCKKIFGRTSLNVSTGISYEPCNHRNFDMDCARHEGSKLNFSSFKLKKILVNATIFGQNSKGRKFTVVLLDSEGIDAANGEGLDDNQIFTLTVLLASVLIYNFQGVPTRRDLEGLEYL